MNIIDTYYSSDIFTNENYDFYLKVVEDSLYVGKTKEGYTSVVVKSGDLTNEKLFQQTALLILKCNIMVSYVVNNECINDKVSAIICKSMDKKIIHTFLRLCDTFIHPKMSANEISEIFRTLNDFFSTDRSYSNAELQGLYCELFTILFFMNKINLVANWQQRDKLKFDFSINQTTKIEVKSTIKTVRQHHFLHEQLATELYNIYILSYKLQEDGSGLNLFDLINKMIPLLSDYPLKRMRLEKVLQSVEEDCLRLFSYNKEYTIANLRAINAKDVPSVEIPASSIDNLSKIEYNAILDDNSNYMDLDSFINTITSSFDEQD